MAVRNDTPFRDRQAAGRAVAEQLTAYQHRSDLFVLGLPRGGVPVAAEVARKLDAPLDVLIVRKIGMPHHSEFAMGAMASIAGRIEIVKNDSPGRPVLTQTWGDGVFDQVAAREREELDRRQQAYRDGRDPVQITGKTVILVDDGLATGATMRAAIAVVKREHPAQLVAAVPIGSRESADEIRRLVDDFVCTSIPEPFWAVGQAYESFEQTTDDEVRRLLRSTSGATDD